MTEMLIFEEMFDPNDEIYSGISISDIFCILLIAAVSKASVDKEGKPRTAVIVSIISKAENVLEKDDISPIKIWLDQLNFNQDCIRGTLLETSKKHIEVKFCLNWPKKE